MYGDGAYGEVSYGEAVSEAGGNQDRVGAAGFSIIASGAGAYDVPAIGSAAFGFDASAISGRSLTKVRVIQTTPTSGRGRTRLSHTGLN